MGGLVLSWLRLADAEGGGPLGPGTLAVSSAEWAAALCCARPPPLPPGTCACDFDGDGDGSLAERLGPLLLPKPGAGAQRQEHLPHVRFAHWLHECIIESKLAAYPLHLLLYLQTQHVADAREDVTLPVHRPSAASCSALALDQLVTVEQFYRAVRAQIGAGHRPLLSEEFLATRCAAARAALAEGGVLDRRLGSALRSRCGSPASAAASASAAATITGLADEALAALYSRLHGLPGDLAQLCAPLGGGPGGLGALPRLRRLFPCASVQALRRLLAILEAGAP